ncbi:uncharacterized protein LOC103524261 [Diaphorina citri]|uniref:Uncharacterized protein LOC103524261 n=1 Tax=Diaphorina citri TaxID=121845 RepID=A0A3Q0JLA6_DIACI|nr:uncharacterized protein LOC103524261 [Diaphorina citri]XP_026689174.1 uncharacterized protein LOC103524261 [Diaphorina citri]
MFRPVLLSCFLAVVLYVNALPNSRDGVRQNGWIDDDSVPDPYNVPDTNWHGEDVPIPGEYIYRNSRPEKENSPADSSYIYADFGYRNAHATADDLNGRRNPNLGAWWNHEGVHNLTVGYKTYQDRLLYQQYVNKEYKLFRVIEQDVSYPVNNTASRYVITLVEAFDIHPNPSGAGYASIIRGGVGRRNITIHLESARNHGLKYLVLIWGHIQY